MLYKGRIERTLRINRISFLSFINMVIYHNIILHISYYLGENPVWHVTLTHWKLLRTLYGIISAGLISKLCAYLETVLYLINRLVFINIFAYVLEIYILLESKVSKQHLDFIATVSVYLLFMKLLTFKWWDSLGWRDEMLALSWQTARGSYSDVTERDADARLQSRLPYLPTLSWRWKCVCVYVCTPCVSVEHSQQKRQRKHMMDSVVIASKYVFQ